MKELWAIHWACPEQGYLVAAILAIVGIIMAYRFWRLYAVITLLSKIVSGTSFLMRASVVRASIKTALYAIAWLFLLLPLLHPQWDKKQEVVAQEGRDLFIALDISRSMLVRDVQPDRLSLAKKKIKSLVGALSCERVGLILFSDSSFICCPLTRDYNAFFMFLDQLDVESISQGSTVVDAAIAQATQAFQSSQPRKSKIVVLVTDGENFSPTLAATKEKAQQAGLTVLALGVGTEHGGPIPLFDPHGACIGHQKDSSGKVVISKLNEALLASLTQDLHGFYVHLNETSSSDIDRIIKHLQSLEKEKIEDRNVEQYQEQYPWFLVISFFALLIEWLL